jgi:hypothetical protein
LIDTKAIKPLKMFRLGTAGILWHVEKAGARSQEAGGRRQEPGARSQEVGGRWQAGDLILASD